MQQPKYGSKIGQSPMSQYIPSILLLMYGFVGGGLITVYLLDGQARAAWQAASTVNVPLFNLVDNIFGYYVVYGLMFLGLVFISLVWRLMYTRRVS